MLDRIRIWDDSKQNVHYELANPDGTIHAHGCIPQNEWHELRAGILRTFPANVSISKLTDYLVVLAEHVW